jgi:hypothetical protein
MGVIADHAAQAKIRRQAIDKRAEADALDPALDGYAAAYDYRPLPPRIGAAENRFTLDGHVQTLQEGNLAGAVPVKIALTSMFYMVMGGELGAVHPFGGAKSPIPPGPV